MTPLDLEKCTREYHLNGNAKLQQWDLEAILNTEEKLGDRGDKAAGKEMQQSLFAPTF